MADAAPSVSPYKVVEISDVTDAAIEEVLNRWNDEGYRVESVHFVTQPGSRRPSMAFLFLVLRGTGA
jgi:hypothetical protein